MAEWWPFQFPDFDKLGPTVKKTMPDPTRDGRMVAISVPKIRKIGPEVKKTMPLGHSQPGTRHCPFGAIFIIIIFFFFFLPPKFQKASPPKPLGRLT